MVVSRLEIDALSTMPLPPPQKISRHHLGPEREIAWTALLLCLCIFMCPTCFTIWKRKKKPAVQVLAMVNAFSGNVCFW